MNNQALNKSKSNSKLFIIIGIVIILLIVSCLLFIKKKKTKTTTEIATIFSSEQPIVIKKDKKYGYIDIEGNIIIEPKYDYASAFNGKYATVKLDDTYQVIDRKGEMKMSSSYSSDIKYISDEKIWIINNQLYDSDLKKLTNDDVNVQYEDHGYLRWTNYSTNQGGIMNAKGKITYTYNFKQGESYLGFDPSDIDDTLNKRYCRLVLDNKKYAIVNCDTGKMIYDYTNKYIYSKDDNIYNVYTDTNDSTVESVIYVQNDKIAYQSPHSKVELSYIDGYVTIRDNSKDYNNMYSYYDTKTDKIIATKPEKVNSSSYLSKWETITGFTVFNCGTGKGIMKKDKVHIDCQWSSIDFFDVLLYQYLKSQGKNYIMTKKDNKSYIIDLKNGNTVMEFNSNYINASLSTFIYYIDNDTKEKVIYNLLTGKTMTTKTENYIYMYPNYITVTEGTKKSYYNTNFKLIYEESN